ncbi:dynamin family protein [Rhodococcus coprophilus]|uniref:dynamin family protein n=1 Tax=Rhodococcus coprophilus TaxID=38310 RepID=UPI0009353FFE|nr:dynamin family protein [Rhodococcus coprophilus]MBM7458911.1 GTPase SAR1 family protein [Rhodococcus coprophilus]
MSANPSPAEVIDGACKVLRAYKLDAVAARAEQKLSGDSRSHAVVVVGEIKRGKSLLVSALIGRDGTSVDDVENSTAVAIRFVAADDEFPEGTAELVFADARRRIDRSELADWTVTGGRKVRDPSVEALPIAAIVPVASPRLAEVAVVDTPGTGGLDPRHAAMAAQSVDKAAVLVLVCDASTPLTEPEMRFLRESASGVENVVVVVTKTDKNLTRWREVVAENRRAITAHVGRDIPVVAVSSVRALAAYQLRPSPARDRALACSGLPELWSLLDERLAAAQRWPVTDALRTVLEGLRQVERTIEEDLTVARDGEKALPDLTAEVERLRGLKDEVQQWEQHLQRDLTLARQRAVARLDEALAEVRESWTTRINKSSMEVLRRSPQVFTARIQADLLAAMSVTAEVFLDDLEQIVAGLFEDGEEWERIREITVTALQAEPLTVGEVASKRQGLLDPSVLTMGMIGTTMLGAAIGAGAIAGVAWVAVNLGFKAMRAGKTNLLTWLRETIATARTATTRMLEAAMATTRPEIVLRRRRCLQDRITELQSRIEEAKRSAQVDAATRTANVERLEKNLRITRGRITPVETALAAATAAGAAA